MVKVLSKHSAPSGAGGRPKLQPSSAVSKWRRLGSKWKERFLLDKNSPGLGSWLDAIMDGKSVRVGCKPCKAACRGSCSFARYSITAPEAIQSCNFLAHAQNGRHKAAVAMFLGGVGGVIDAPSVEEYKALVVDIQKGVATCGTLKRAKMTWTLSEGVKSIDQDRVEKADSMALFRDESKSRLEIRFRTVSPTLDVHQGFLGQEVDFGTGSLNITHATAKVMKRFSMRFSGAPGKPRRKSFVKKHVLKNMRQAVRIVTVDAAADEILSVEMMRSASLAGMRRKLTPKLQFLNRDKTHGSRRLTSRGWGADPYLADVINMLARGRGSIARIVQNSPAIRVQYKKFCHTSFRSVRKVVKNMRAAKHRYETMTKPLGRGVLYVVANIKTAAWCAQTRADSSGSRSKVWLQWVNEERYLQGSMQADASDQVMMVTRLLDDEKTDPAIVNREISACLCTLVSLFGDEKRCLEVFGYTRTMLDILRKPIVWHVGNKLYSLGSHSGVSDEVIDRCLQRMRCWLTLLKATCAAEFPSFEIMQARSCSELRIFF